MNDIHSSSTHMGSFPSFAGFVGTHVHPFVPARSVTALPFCHSSIVAFSEMKLGAAVSALAIFCASVHCACPRTRLDEIADGTRRGRRSARPPRVDAGGARGGGPLWERPNAKKPGGAPPGGAAPAPRTAGGGGGARRVSTTSQAG